MKKFGVDSGKPITETSKSLASKEWSEEARLQVNQVMGNGGNSRRKGLNVGEKEVKRN